MKMTNALLLVTATLVGSALLVASAPAHANEAHVCHSKSVQFRPSPGHPQPAFPELTDHTEFTCPGIGTKTIPELARKGWTIVQVTASNDGSGAGGLALSYMLVIQRP